MTTESVKLDRAIVRRLRRYSKRTGIPISVLANRILDVALKNQTWLELFSQFDNDITKTAAGPKTGEGKTGV